MRIAAISSLAIALVCPMGNASRIPASNAEGASVREKAMTDSKISAIPSAVEERTSRYEYCRKYCDHYADMIMMMDRNTCYEHKCNKYRVEERRTIEECRQMCKDKWAAMMGVDEATCFSTNCYAPKFAWSLERED